MVLHPLAQICIGVFVSIRIGGSQLMMDILGDSKRGEGEQNEDQAERESPKTQ